MLQHWIALVCALREEVNDSASKTLTEALQKQSPGGPRLGEARAVVLRGGGEVLCAHSDLLVEPMNTSAYGCANVLERRRFVRDCRAWRPDSRWTSLLRLGKSGARDVLVLNVGQHLHDPSDDGTGAVELIAELALRHLAGVDFRGTVFYRTNYRPGCLAPDDDRGVTELSHYNWLQLADGTYDTLWLRAACRLYPRLRVLNVTPASAQRFNAHVGLAYPGIHNVTDCLHWCLPGPIDMWNVALQNELLDVSSW